VKKRSALLFLSPFLATFCVFSLFPLAASIALSFLDWSPLNPSAGKPSDGHAHNQRQHDESSFPQPHRRISISGGQKPVKADWIRFST